MKVHTNDLKTNIARMGKDLDSKITYTDNGSTVELGTEQLNSITPHYKADICKSVMRQLDVDSNVDIPIGTVINYQFGVKVGNSYEYLNYGNYVVNKSERQEDYRSYKLTCYDKMLYSMVDYETPEIGGVAITYPITIRNYINAICTHLGLTFKNANDTFTNYDKEIASELYLDEDGNSLGYKFRDVLDELAQVTASTICINDDDELEIRYIEDATNDKTVSGANISITDGQEYPTKDFKLSKLSTQSGTPTPDNPIEVNTVKGYRNYFDYASASDVNNTVQGTYRTFEISGLKPNTQYNINNMSFTSGISNTYIYLWTTTEYASSTRTPIITPSYYTNKVNFTSNNEGKIYLAINPTDTTSWNNLITYFEYAQIEEGTQQQPYVPYGTNWIYGKITGKNLAYTGWENEFISRVNNSSYAKTITEDNRNCLYYKNAIGNTVVFNQDWKENTQYTFSFYIKTNYSPNLAIEYVDGTITQIARTLITVDTWSKVVITSTSNKTIKYLRGVNEGGYDYIDLDTFQIEEGTQPTTYEPYQENIIKIPLNDNEICGIGNYKDEYIVDKNGHCWLNKKIGKIVLDGSENFWNFSSATGRYSFWFKNNSIDAILEPHKKICNYFIYSGKRYDQAPIPSLCENSLVQPNNVMFIFNTDGSQGTTVAQWQTWLNEHNVIVYYCLKETQLIDLNYDVDLSLYDGTNNISNNENADMSLTYAYEFDTIDEDYFKDINVDFGQKYGPINSIVLSRSAESDNIYAQDDESITENGLCELKIIDNQILNGNDRADYLDGILNRLNGLEYYINDYSSPGIMYYNLCDRYRAKIGDNTYQCVMLNDEALVTQGLQENIHTDMPVVSETDYSKADKTDRRINQAYLIVNKQESTIKEYTSKTDDLILKEGNDYIELKDKFNGYTPTSRTANIETSVTRLQTDTYTKTEVNEKLTDGSVTKVNTTSVILDINGMTYEKNDAETTTTVNNVGVNVKDKSNNSILFAGYVEQTNPDYGNKYKGQTIVATQNIIVSHYMTVGSHSRFEDYSSGTGVFYV